ncbi:MAG: hypothetical protein J6P38_05235 [Acetobacter sp.]|nr:hypothetical protein [Acetobacter sp.]
MVFKAIWDALVQHEKAKLDAANRVVDLFVEQKSNNEPITTWTQISEDEVPTHIRNRLGRRE